MAKTRRSLAALTAAVLTMAGVACGAGTSTGTGAGGGAPSTAPSTTNLGVALVIVDDFTIDASTVQASVQKNLIQPGKNCAVTPDGDPGWTWAGQNVYGMSGASGETVPNVAHGDLVFQEAQHALSDDAQLHMDGALSQAATQQLASQPGVKDAEVWTAPGSAPRVYLTKLDTLNYDTAQIAYRMQSLAHAMQTQLNVHRVVFNMSFAVIPCDLGIGSTDPRQLLAQYLELLAEHPELTGLKQELDSLVGDPNLRNDLLIRPQFGLLRLLWFYVGPGSKAAKGSGYLSKDPINLWLMSAGPSVVAVGAAGNVRSSGLAFPFAPSIWPTVVSASAYQTVGGPKAKYSNAGEVMLDGTYLTTGTYGSTTGIVGTSFAAPILSVLEAVYLVRHTQACPSTGATQNRPPLKYATLTGPWLNLTAHAAATHYCPAFNVALTNYTG